MFTEIFEISYVTITFCIGVALLFCAIANALINTSLRKQTDLQARIDYLEKIQLATVQALCMHSYGHADTPTAELFSTEEEFSDEKWTLNLVRNCHPSLVKYLVENGMEVNSAHLTHAAYGNKIETVKYIRELCDVEWHPLKGKCAMRNLEILKYYVRDGGEVTSDMIRLAKKNAETQPKIHRYLIHGIYAENDSQSEEESSAESQEENDEQSEEESREENDEQSEEESQEEVSDTEEA